MCRRHTGTSSGVHRAEAPAIESAVRRSRTAAEPPSRSRLLGPERSREPETSSGINQLPETGPQGRIYRQLDDGAPGPLTQARRQLDSREAVSANGRYNGRNSVHN